ncbi:MAG: hypothetical protein K2M97_00745 [Muribaculaceae bacterium]|nr:hypothetical protein [Muribaculaceae bacterium]
MTRRLKRILYSICAFWVIGFCLGLWCGHALWYNPVVPEGEVLEEVSLDDEPIEDDEPDEIVVADSVSTEADDTDYDSYLDEMPEDNMVKLKVRPIGGSLGKVFNDSNRVHLEAAAEIGIDPIETIADAWNLRRPVVKVQSNRHYVVDRLTHSLPYLVPEAAKLLDDIGCRFADSLAARGGGDYRVKVTSVLRTPSTVKRLRRVNRNASSQSAHQYGTTFDISYVNFACGSSTDRNRTQQDLKNLLAEVLRDLRDEGRCYVKYERKQGCFHITARRGDRECDESQLTMTFK